MLQAFKRWLFEHPQDVIGLDIGEGFVKLAEVSFKRGKPAGLKACGMEALPEGAVEDGRILNKDRLAETIRRLVIASGAASRDVVASVSGRSLFVREVIMPVMTREELHEAIQWDIDKYVPYPPENCYFDFDVIGKGENEHELRLLLVITPKELVDDLVQVLKHSGLRPVAIDIEANALQRSIPSCENSLVVDLGARQSHIFIYQNGGVAVTRTIPLGGNRFTEAIANVTRLSLEEAEQIKVRGKRVVVSETGLDNEELQTQMDALITDLAREIQRTADYYQVQHRGATIDRVIVTGGGARLKDIQSALASLLEVEVVAHDPFAGLQIPSSLDDGYIRSLAPQLCVAVGLSLRGGDSAKINLLPLAERRPKWPLRKLHMVTTAAVCLLLAGLYGYAAFSAWSLERQIADMRNRQELLRPTTVKMSAANALQQQITVKSNLMINLTKGKRSWYAIVAHFGAVTPASIWFTEMSAMDKGGLRLKGMSQSYLDLAQFMEKLSKDEMVGEPVLISADKENAAAPTSFEMTVKFKE